MEPGEEQYTDSCAACRQLRRALDELTVELDHVKEVRNEQLYRTMKAARERDAALLELRSRESEV